MGRRNRRWHLLGSFLVPAVQAVIFAIGLRQLSLLVDRPWLFSGALAGAGLVLGILLAVAIALLLLTELPARLAMIAVCRTGPAIRVCLGPGRGDRSSPRRCPCCWRPPRLPSTEPTP